MALKVPEVCRFTVEGAPVPKARARVAYKGGVTVSYTPEATRAAQDAISWQAKAAWGQREPLQGPVQLVVVCYLSIPPSWSAERIRQAEQGEILPIRRPDWDNLGKLVSDALNGIAWKDDSQVVQATVGKWYSSRPRTVVIVGEIAP